jgi:hypothetical protein
MKSIFASFAIILVACTHGTDPGTGTGTILVTGTAHADSQTVNAATSTSFVTQFDFDLQINYAPVTTGTVTLTSQTGVATLTFQQNGGGNNGTWQGMSANYDPVYELNVTAGPDNIKGVYVQGPDIHLFQTPTAGASLDSTMTITTTWKRSTTAEEARFGVGDVQGLVIPDSQTYAIPAGTLHANRGQATPNTMRLTRSNSVVPKGALAGSMVSVEITQTLDVVALPCTGC